MSHISRTILPKLRSPSSRVFFLLMLASLVAIVVCAIAFGLDQGYDGDRWAGQIAHLLWPLHPYRWYEKIPPYAALTAAAGYVFAFHHDATIGRLMHWIRTGRAQA